MIVNYTCKFCHTPGAVEIEESKDVEISIAKWVSMLACNRCADYHSERLVCSAAVRGIAIAFMQLKSALSANELEVPTAMRQAFQRRCAKWTKRFVTNAANFYRRVPAWEPEMVEQIMEKPERWGDTLAQIFRTVTR